MRHRRQGGPISGLVFGLLFAVIGYFTAFTFGKPILDDAKASSGWPTTSGVVTESAVQTDLSNNKRLYNADVAYRFQVDGRDFTGDKVYFGATSSSDSTAAHDIVGRYPLGAAVVVHYQPDNPANAVLEPGARWQSYLVYGIGLAFLVVGLLVFGGSLFHILAAGAVVGGAVGGAAAGWLVGEPGRDARHDRFGPGAPSNDISRPGPNRSDASGKQDDGFDLG